MIWCDEENEIVVGNAIGYKGIMRNLTTRRKYEKNFAGNTIGVVEI